MVASDHRNLVLCLRWDAGGLGCRKPLFACVHRFNTTTQFLGEARTRLRRPLWIGSKNHSGQPEQKDRQPEIHGRWPLLETLPYPLACRKHRGRM